MLGEKCCREESHKRLLDFMFTGVWLFSGVLRFLLSFLKEMGCMDELVRNMDMIHYEYLVCYDD